MADLLDKSAVLLIIEDAKTALAHVSKSDREAAKIVCHLGKIASVANCCVTNWDELSCLYQWAFCTLKRAVPFFSDINNASKSGRFLQYLDALESAGVAVEPYVVASIMETPNRQKLESLGFLIE